MALSKEELSGLVERVRGLKGPDREVDRLIFDTLLGGLFWPENRDFFTRDHTWTAVPKEFTGSADAALALAERKLGDEWYAVLLDALREFGGAGVLGPDHLPRFILLALLLSLQSQEPTL